MLRVTAWQGDSVAAWPTVILSGAKNLLLLRINSARNLRADAGRVARGRCHTLAAARRSMPA